MTDDKINKNNRANAGRVCLYLAGAALLALILKVFMPDNAARLADEEILLGALGMLLISGLAALGFGGQIRVAIANLIQIWAGMSESGKRKRRHPSVKSQENVDLPSADNVP